MALGYLFFFVSLLASRQGFWRLVAQFFDFFVFVPVVQSVLLILQILCIKNCFVLYVCEWVVLGK